MLRLISDRCATGRPSFCSFCTILVRLDVRFLWGVFFCRNPRDVAVSACGQQQAINSKRAHYLWHTRVAYVCSWPGRKQKLGEFHSQLVTWGCRVGVWIVMFRNQSARCVISRNSRLVCAKKNNSGSVCTRHHFENLAPDYSNCFQTSSNDRQCESHFTF
jgi:hypothetical protein